MPFAFSRLLLVSLLVLLNSPKLAALAIVKYVHVVNISIMVFGSTLPLPVTVVLATISNAS